MKPKLISWNIRGLNEIDKRSRVKNLLRQWKADIICLQETKLESISSIMVRSLLGCLHTDWCYVPSNGTSGGILLMWDRRTVEKIEVCTVEFVAAASFRSVDDDFVWAFMGVYDPNIDLDRKFLWEELASLISWWDLPWCISSNFNVTRFPSERSRNAHQSPAMLEFSDFISDKGLMDFPLEGGTFTWSNNGYWSKLDWFIVSPQWEVKYPNLL